jgi:hypothetical protein
MLTNQTLDYYVDDQNGQPVKTTLKTDRKGRAVVLIQPDGGIILIEQDASKIGIRLELVCTERYKELKFNIYIGRKIIIFVSSINQSTGSR